MNTNNDEDIIAFFICGKTIFWKVFPFPTPRVDETSICSLSIFRQAGIVSLIITERL